MKVLSTLTRHVRMKAQRRLTPMSKVIACGVPVEMVTTHTRDRLRDLLTLSMSKGLNAPVKYDGRIVTERFRIDDEVYNLIKYYARFSGRSFHEYTADVLHALR
jgi:hypothetical protein